jgi:hypothetical protein
MSKSLKTIDALASSTRSLGKRYSELLELREKVKDSFSQVFTLEVDGRPTLSFVADCSKEAQEICKRAWLRDDLSGLSSGGVPICVSQSRLSVRSATGEETAIFEQAAEIARPTNDMVLAYLVELDV